MRHDITKKVISAMLSGVLMLSLAGCGKAAKLPETVVNTSLVVEKDGKVVSYLVNTFDKDFYSLDGLTQMVEEEAEEFNATHTEATENPMNVKTVQVLGDGVMVQVVQEFADTDSYAEYNEQDLFYGGLNQFFPDAKNCPTASRASPLFLDIRKKPVLGQPHSKQRNVP